MQPKGPSPTVVDSDTTRYFAKNGHIDEDPKKVKKEGGGKGNW
jgi:hypothetical protein